jgi:hypothetical protein
MSEPTSVVVKVAATPDEAKVYAARLQAEGIPAFVDPDAAADEFAITQRLMNLTNVRVMVPASDLERAKEILAPTELSPEELAAQALAVTDGAETPARSRPPAPITATPRSFWVALVATFAALVFLVLWLEASSRYADDPLYRYERTDDGWALWLRRNGEPFAHYVDENRDGIIEKSIYYGPGGTWTSTADEMDRDGYALRATVYRKGDHGVVWTRTDATTDFDRAEVVDASGSVVQRLRWVPQRGFVIE